jgi:hypothetical protein
MGKLLQKLVATVTFAAAGSMLFDLTAVQGADVWKVDGKLIGKTTKSGKIKKAEDVSGIACIQTAGFPRTCLLIDDETQFAQFVTLYDGRIKAGETVGLISDIHDSRMVEFDGEGVAFHDRYFYAMGSHGRPRSESENPSESERARIAARERASSRLVRIEVDPATGQLAGATPVRASTELKKLISADAKLGPLTQVPLNQDGITIEGIAILNDRLYAGFRGPSSTGGLILSASLGAFFGGKSADAVLYALALGDGRGVRDLAVHGNSILVLAGPTVGEGGQFSIYSWNGSGSDAHHLKDLPKYGDGLKPEALLPLDEDGAGTLRVLVILDGAEEGAPRVENVKLR